ncbi:MAG TPA: arginase [Chloroflexi bacterium]|nr:arginase [Chloroflexota bacterium]
MTKPLSSLQIIAIHYLNAERVAAELLPLAVYETSGVYGRARIPYTIAEPKLPEAQRVAEETDNLGLLGGEVAAAVAQARREGKGILMAGGNCCHITGIFGGLQDAHGPELKIGLVWFDAHGDFNTRHTSLSGMLGGMPVAVCAGLTYPRWRELSHIAAPLPTDRIVMVDVRNLDAPEEQLIRATDITIARIAEGRPGDVDLSTAVTDLASRVDLIYFHIDSDILDESYTPNHWTKEPDGPDMAQVQAAMDTVFATGKVGVFAVVSVFGGGEGEEIAIQSGIDLIGHGLERWAKYGRA